ncbi:TetR family transcriptional regulator [Sphingobacterium sp. DK4209]|uniref:TetR family transcriptional regulator n=1 Tax=Sphingobacterium zhuxiongii TaxID=2662364 RepID=A0A5Q0Q930_9SPHI|nr:MULTISPECIES: TetR/AcrR family transcriptional regulator [unclassified Sphingobacterium]MVZ64433.1 TetR family transcriptional regulator [Sphingobacterium sp. DK4209]QGA25774.1 TetR family transcriptional regulator [Sphingobacterium sp. dk4302]
MENRKEQIIEAALKRFSHFGFQKTTMNEIAEDLRITKANLYYYYPDKTSLILAVLHSVIDNIHADEQTLINKYNGNLIDTLVSILEMRASFLRKYYVLHIAENLDWLKGMDIQCTMEGFYNRDVECISALFKKAVDSGEVALENAADAAAAYVELTKGVSILHTVSDIITGIPNEQNVELILASQIRATKLIFAGKIK